MVAGFPTMAVVYGMLSDLNIFDVGREFGDKTTGFLPVRGSSRLLPNTRPESPGDDHQRNDQRPTYRFGV